MQIVTTPSAARALARTLAQPIGFVATMGALHAGHRSLLERASAENASVVGSIFINPLQFGQSEDFERYPRLFESDAAVFAAAGTALLYAPNVAQMYPAGFASTIDVGELARRFEGAQRPGHFSGVATVVAKLLHTVEPATLYLGQKDAQQVAVVRRMIADLDLPVGVTVCPTIRESDGLALSSRNVYLTPDQRKAAPSLFRALRALADEIRAVAGDVRVGRGDPAEAKTRARRLLGSPLEWDYLDVVDPLGFEPLPALGPPALAIGAVRAGATRLIDNIPIPEVG